MTMSVPNIHGHRLQVTAVGCNNVADTDWISRQQYPCYVCIDYGGIKYLTITSTDGAFKNNTVDITLIEGLRELDVIVCRISTINPNGYEIMGSAKVPLHKVLAKGYEDSSWPLLKANGSLPGEIRLRLEYANANKRARSWRYGPSSSSVKAASRTPPPPGYPYPSPYSAPSYPPYAYPPASSPAYPQPPPSYSYPQDPTPYSPYRPAYPLSPYPPPPRQPPFSYQYPPLYPPPPSAYPPPPPSAYPPPQPPSNFHTAPILQGLFATSALLDLISNLSQLLGG